LITARLACRSFQVSREAIDASSGVRCNRRGDRAGGERVRATRGRTYNGIPGQFSSIQAAVDAAQSGDAILVAPGDYKTTSHSAPSGADGTPAAVRVTEQARPLTRNR
jgi:hypothetical protein